MNRSKVLDWIFTRPQGSEYWLLPLFIVAWDQLYNIFVAQLLFTSDDLIEISASKEEILIASWEFPFELILGATIEELLFRILPLVILLRYIKSRWLIVLFVLLLSSAFALIHGGWETLLMQGVGGLIYSVLFIKYYDNGMKLIEASVVVILTHIIFNLLGVLLSVSADGNTF